MSKSIKIIIYILSVLIILSGGYYYVLAGTLDPTSAPGKTMKTIEDIYCKFTGCTPANYTIDSPGSPAAAMHTLQEVYDAIDFDNYGRGWIASSSGNASVSLTQSACEASADWKWFEDGNSDGDTIDAEDGICVQVSSLGTIGSWNGYVSSTNYENSYIAAYTCSGSFPNGTVATYSGINSGGTADTTWNDGDCALCEADCYDGRKDLPDQGSWTTGNSASSGGIQGPLTPEILKKWKGTRLPTHNDFFGFCGATSGDSETTAGDGTYHSSGASSDKTLGSYGQNVGRGANSAPNDEYVDLSNSGSYEWFSEQYYQYGALLAGEFACSNSVYSGVIYGNRARAVFRP